MATQQEKIELLKKIAHRFNACGVTWALGASMLLYFKGIAPDFHDIDLMISTSDVEQVRSILSEIGTLQPPNPNPKYHTKAFLEFVIDAMDVDIMAGFSILCDGKLYDCSLQKEQIVEYLTLDGEKIPLQSPQLWCEYYRLMGRPAKVEMIETALAAK